MATISKSKGKFQILSILGSSVRAIYLGNDEPRVPSGSIVIVGDSGGRKYDAPSPPFENPDGPSDESFGVYNKIDLEEIMSFTFSGIFCNSCTYVKPKKDIGNLRQKFQYLAIELENEQFVVNESPA